MKPVTTLKVDVDGGEAAILIRKDATIETYMKLNQVVGEPSLLALGISWSCENDDWKLRLMRRARTKLLDLMGAADTSKNQRQQHTHDEGHDTLIENE
tara:strand:- start:25657 stop:25950 length:294 start_codon:yes stop_codon:yes gene_type:complete